MDFKELQDTLQKLTKSKITLTQIGQALGIKLSTVSTRIKNHSQLKYNEIKTIEKYFNVNLSNINNYNSNNYNSDSASFYNPKIQFMVNDMGLGISVYGMYHIIIEKIILGGINQGEEILLAQQIGVDVQIIKAILNNYGLFNIINGKYKSIFPEHNANIQEFLAPKFEDVKKDILKEVEKMLKKKGINLV